MENKNKYNNSARNKSKQQSRRDNSKTGFGTRRVNASGKGGVLSLTQLLNRAGKKRSSGDYSVSASSTRLASQPQLSGQVQGQSNSLPESLGGTKALGAGRASASELTDKQANRSFPSGALRNTVSNVSNVRDTQNKQGSRFVDPLGKNKAGKAFNNGPGTALRTSASFGLASPSDRDARNELQFSDRKGSGYSSLLQGTNTVGGRRLQTRSVTKDFGKRGLDREDQSGQIPLKPIIPPKSLIIILKEKPEKILYNRRIIDYKHCGLLQRYIGLGGKILPRRQTRLTARQQRYIAKTIKTARIMGLLPFVSKEKSYFK